MLDKIMELVGGNALNELTSKAGISMDQAKQMLPLAQDSLQEGLMSQITGGNLDGLIGMFNSAGSGSSSLMNNSIFNGIKGMFLQKIMKNIGLPESIAGLAAGTGMGSIIDGISGLLKSDGDNEDINASKMNVLGGGGAGSMLGSLLGGKEGGIMDSIGDVAGDLLGGSGSDKGGGVGGMLGKLFGK